MKTANQIKHQRHDNAQIHKSLLQRERHHILSTSTIVREHLMALDCNRRQAKVIYPSTKYLILCQSA